MATPQPSTFASPLSGDILVDAITTGYKWTLNFDRTIDWSISGGFNGEVWNNPNLVYQYVKVALETFENVANIKFNFIGFFSNPSAASIAGSEINYWVSGNTAVFPSSFIWARAYFPTTAENAAYNGAPGDVVLNINSAANTLPTYAPGSDGWFLILHETGHALGLKHPHDDGGTGRPTLSEVGLGVLDIDTVSIMSYEDDLGFSNTAYDPATPMLLDVIGLQYLYGPNMTKNSGDGVYTLSATGFYATIWDAGGHDEVSAATSDRGWRVVLPSYDYTNARITELGYALPASEYDYDLILNLRWLIGSMEDATGSNFNDSLIGNSISNILAGNGGADFIDGAAGQDSLIGGSGADLILGGSGNDLIDGGSLGDTLYGETGRDTILGNSGADYVEGGDGDDLLGEATDSSGNDTYWGGAGDDLIGENAGSNYLRGEAGNDIISGGSGFDDINGNQGNDTAYGNDGDDWVVGGRDNDLLFGDAGFDIVYGNMGNDTVDGGAGNDWVRGGQGDDSVMGGTGDDWIWGDRGNDTISGGAGADLFYSLAGAGIDRITDFSYAAGDRLKLEGGPSRTVLQSGADVVVDMGNGDQVILVGVSLSSLGAGWIL